MKPTEYPLALERAAAPVMAAIERDQQRAPKRLEPVFAAIAEMLFEADLELEQIAWEAGFDDPDVFLKGGKRDIFSELREEVGQPAWSYVRHARLETAARLLLETPISLSEIGRMVGYISRSSFRRRLRDFLGMSASQYRRQAPRILERGGPAPDGSDTAEYWERMLAGELSDGEARELDAYLERLAPASGPEPAAGGETERWRRLREALADGFVYTLQHLSFADQRRLARDAVWFPDGTFFERLSRQSREVAPEDPQRAIEWALLAIDSLAANGMLETHPGRAAVAWARLALARWRAGDLDGAEKDLEQSAGDAGRTGSGDFPAAWEAESRRVTAAFHWLRGRRRQALALAHRSVAAHRKANAGELPKALILRAELGAVIADHPGGEPAQPVETDPSQPTFQEALADVEEAASLRPAEDEERAAATGLWALILVRIGDRAEMVVALPHVRRLATDLGDRAEARLLWLEGHCATAAPDAGSAAGAGSLWRQASERFAALGDDLSAARVTLDLARLCLTEERAREASTLAADLVSKLGALVTAPADLAALKTLGRAATAPAAVAAQDLDRADHVLKQLEWDRRANRALRLAL